MCSDSDTSNISQSSFILEKHTLLAEDNIVFQPNVNAEFSDESDLSTIGDQCDAYSCRNKCDLRNGIREENSMYQTARDEVSLTCSLPTGSHDQEKYGNMILLIGLSNINDSHKITKTI